MSESSGGTGRLYGVGLGPGDPDLMTLRAVRAIGDADVIAYHSARHGRSIARSIAAAHLRPDHIEEALVYPVTTETTDHPGGYRGALEEFYEEAAARLATHLDAGRTVAVLAEGDPMFYGSYMHMHKRLADRYPTEVIPGVTSVSAAAARLGTPLVEGEEILTILPGTLPEEELTARLAATDTAVVMKLGRTFPAVRGAFEASGRLPEARYVERATMAGERTGDLADIDPESVPYFSVAVLPSRVDAPRPAPSASGEVVVVGTGPAGPLWLTPETRGALAAADAVIGYTTYLDRVPAEHGGTGDVEVTVSVDHGEEIARSTWNGRLGILGGLSILGTTGVVVPYSCSAWIDSIRRGVDVARAAGLTHVAGCTGSTSERTVVAEYGLPDIALLDMGDFAGAVLKYVRRHPVDRLTVCGGFAKLSKLAAGHLDLHSARSQVDKPFLAALARTGGANEELASRIATANTGLEALRLCEAAGVPLGDLVAARAREEALSVLRGAPVAVDVLCVDRAGVVVGRG
ncbi:Cobalt-precorrin-5B C(1)-methyltransferase [Streptomyces griseus subsp. griseus]